MYGTWNIASVRLLYAFFGKFGWVCGSVYKYRKRYLRNDTQKRKSLRNFHVFIFKEIIVFFTGGLSLGFKVRPERLKV
jgi:hypothetical protein